MNILICGDRRWNNQERIKEILSDFRNDDVVVYYKLEQGAALIGKVTADQLGMKSRLIAEDNTDYLRYMDLILAFHNYIRGSKKTLEILHDAEIMGKQYRVIKHDD